MRIRWIVIAALVAAVPSAHADDSFEARAGAAQPVNRLDGVVWALTARCDRGDDTERRQCRLVRDARASELAGTTLLVEADPGAFAAGAWDAQKKSVPLRLDGCIRCGGVDVDGKPWFLVAAGKGPHGDGSKVSADVLYTTARVFTDANAAAAWTRTLAHARVDLVVKVPAKPRWSAAGKDGLALDVVAYRVIAPCDGSVVLASPPSGPVAAEPGLCPKAAPTKPVVAPAAAGVPEALSPAMIEAAMQPVMTAAQTCYVMYGVRGRANLQITVAADGAITGYQQTGAFAGTPTGACLDKAAKAVKFPRTQKPSTTFTYPIPLP